MRLKRRCTIILCNHAPARKTHVQLYNKTIESWTYRDHACSNIVCCIEYYLLSVSRMEWVLVAGSPRSWITEPFLGTFNIGTFQYRHFLFTLSLYFMWGPPGFYSRSHSLLLWHAADGSNQSKILYFIPWLCSFTSAKPWWTTSFMESKWRWGHKLLDGSKLLQLN